MNAITISRAVALAAYLDGFQRGADEQCARKRHVVDPRTDRHWRRGFMDGAKARVLAKAVYRDEMEREERDAKQDQR